MAEACGVCGRNRNDHKNDDIHHEFNAEGQLVAKAKKKAPPANARPHILANPNEPEATRLAAVLHSRGIIDDEDLVWVLTGRKNDGDTASRPSTPGDFRARSQKGSV